MKLEDYSNEVVQAQMQAFANQLRKATSAEICVVMVGGAVSDESGQACACAMDFDMKLHSNAGKAQMDASFVMLKTAATVLDRVSRGAIKVHINIPGSQPFDISKGDIREFITR